MGDSPPTAGVDSTGAAAPPMAGRSSSEYELVYEYEPPPSSTCFDGGKRCGGNGGGGVSGGGGGGGTRTPDLCSPRANTLPTLPLGVAGPPLRLLEPAAALPTAGTLLLEPVALPTAGAPFLLSALPTALFCGLNREIRQRMDLGWGCWLDGCVCHVVGHWPSACPSLRACARATGHRHVPSLRACAAG